MNALRSHLLTGKVRHRRSQPMVYELEHDVFYFALDLTEIDEVAKRFRLFSRNRFNVLALHDHDHFVPPASDLRAAVLSHLRHEGFDPERWRITFIATPRVLGYQFNPASFYLCRDETGTMQVVIVEVHNTHHERRLYTMRPQRKGNGWIDSFDKDFYVSPFIDMDARYTVRVQDDPDRVRIAITETELGKPLLTATLVAERVRLTDKNLMRTLLRVPLATQKTIVAIHLHAWRMWRRGFQFRRHSEVTR